MQKLEYNEIVVTNRHLCRVDFLLQVEKIAQRKPWAILLREKDLDAAAYAALAAQVKERCGDMPLIAHTHAIAGLPLHVPFSLNLPTGASVSVHTTEEAKHAQIHGARFLIAGHIFETQCKPDLRPRGLAFLREICESVDIPVFAIGGITSGNAQLCLEAGAAGVCRMSYWMKSPSMEDNDV